MANTLFIGILTWVILTSGVIALAVYRKYIARGEFDVIHISEAELPMVPHQAAFAKQLEQLDFWGQALTIASLSYGLLLAVLFLYQVWQQQPNL